ncbi:MFS transporter [Micromonospora sp. R77]|nr:MFS transporter [Micromonospora sp. R77]MCI4063784.1 MFS transporter [Micromonospora sp. R77]
MVATRPTTNAARVGAGAVATTVACVLPVFLVGGLAVQLGAELGFSPAGLGLAVSVYFGISALASTPSGALVERYGPAVVARAGILLSAGSLLAVAGLARSYPTLVGLLGLSAAANALGQLASNAALARHVPAHRQGLSFGVKQAAVPISTLLAGAAVPAVALTVGWRWAFVAAAVAALAALPAVPLEEPARDRQPAAARSDRATLALVVVGLAATLAAAAANALGTFVVASSAGRGLSPPWPASPSPSAARSAWRPGSASAGSPTAGRAGTSRSSPACWWSAPAGWACSHWPARCRWSPAWCSASAWAGPGPG